MWSLNPIQTHGGQAAAADLWTQWNFDLLVLAGMVLPSLLYALGLRRLWRRAGRYRGVRRYEALAFSAGMLALFAALVSPLAPLGGVLFAAHMTQHVFLMLIAAPLVAASSPGLATLWGLPQVLRRALASLARIPRVRRAIHALGSPGVAWSVHAIALWIWHAPALYQGTLTSHSVHTLQHLSFFLSALWFWWVFARMLRDGRAGVALLYVFTTSVHSSVLGALLTFSTNELYPAYGESGRAFGLTLLQDQQLGGLIMWVPGGLVFLAGALLAALRWINPSMVTRVPAGAAFLYTRR